MNTWIENTEFYVYHHYVHFFICEVYWSSECIYLIFTKKTQIDVVGVSVFILEIPYHLKTPQSVVNSISPFFPLRPVCLNSVFTTIVHGLISRIYIDVQNIKFSDCCLLFRLLNLNFFGLTIAYFHFNIKLVIRL